MDRHRNLPCCEHSVQLVLHCVSVYNCASTCSAEHWAQTVSQHMFNCIVRSHYHYHHPHNYHHTIVSVICIDSHKGVMTLKACALREKSDLKSLLNNEPPHLAKWCPLTLKASFTLALVPGHCTECLKWVIRGKIFLSSLFMVEDANVAAWVKLLVMCKYCHWGGYAILCHITLGVQVYLEDCCLRAMW